MTAMKHLDSMFLAQFGDFFERAGLEDFVTGTSELFAGHCFH
jgi:hypothetical protein